MDEKAAAVIMGIDGGTQDAGLAVLEGDRLLWSATIHLLPTVPTIHGLSARLTMLRKAVIAAIQRWTPEIIGIEGAIEWGSRDRKGKATVGAAYGMLVEVCGAISAARLLSINPTTVKRCLSGSGFAGKEAMIWSAKARYHADLGEHEADACGVALGVQEVLMKEAMAVQQSLFVQSVGGTGTAPRRGPVPRLPHRTRTHRAAGSAAPALPWWGTEPGAGGEP